MGKHKRRREKEDKEDRENIWKKLKAMEDLLKKSVDALLPALTSHHDISCGPGNNNDMSKSPVAPTSLVDAEADFQFVQTCEPIAQASQLGLPQQPLNETNESVPIADQDISPLPESAESLLDDEQRRILGDDPRVEIHHVGILHSELAARWSSWISEGLRKEVKDELLLTHPRADNCPLQAQILNPEVAATMNEAALKRDKYTAETQNLTGSAMLALGLAISALLDENGEEGIDKNQFLEYLCDAGKLLAEAHHHEAMTRKSSILPGLEKKMKEVLDKSKVDQFLFGEDLSEKIKSTKSIEKIASDLKPKTTDRRVPPRQSNHLNWKAPPLWNQGSTKATQTGNPDYQ